MLEMEFEKPEYTDCACCGNTTTTLKRYVYKDNDAFAVYIVRFTPCHSENMLDGIIGLGPWGYENIGAEARSAFFFKMRSDRAVMMVDGDAEPWANASFLGKPLSR